MGSTSLYELIRTAIVNGLYRPGEGLTEAVLAETYNVSRTPVRDALRRLEQEGVLERQGRQLVVHETTPEEVLEIYDCRIVLEGMAAGWAARSRTEYDLMLLGEIHRQMAEFGDRSPTEMSRINHKFHDQLWKASHNATLRDLLHRLEVHVLRYPSPTVSLPGRWEEVVREHGEMIEAVRRRDSETATRLASQHMERARELRLRTIHQDAGEGASRG